MGSVRFVEGPEKFPTQRVYRFSEDLHTQKLLLGKILGGDTIQLRFGACLKVTRFQPKVHIPTH